MKINIDIAKSFIGVPYVWGGDDVAKEGGLDCSGFIYKVLNGSGVKVGRTNAQGYYYKYKNYRINEAPQTGDLLFFGKSLNNISHVALAIDDQRMIESVGTSKNTIKNKGKGVCINRIDRRKDLRAVIRFKNVSRETLIIPDCKPNLKIGSKGVQVERLQKCLNVLFSAGLKVDGHFGSVTRRAVVNFQSASGLVADGVYGSHSYDIIRNLVLIYNGG